MGVDLLIDSNRIYSADSASSENGIDINVATTGIISFNSINTLQGTDVDSLLDPGSCLCNENYVVNAINEHGVVAPKSTATT